MNFSTPKDYSLTCGQRWLVYRSAKSSKCCAPLKRVYMLTPDFNFCAFVEAMQRIVILHPALRLRLVKNGRHWRQSFPYQPAVVSEMRVKGPTRSFRSIYAHLWIAEEGRKPLDLTRDSPVKAIVLKVNKSYLLSLCIDHIAIDGIGFNRLEKELVASYRQVLDGISQLPVYADSFLVYLQKEGKNQCLEDSNLLYWKRHLTGLKLQKLQASKKPFAQAQVVNYCIDAIIFDSLKDYCDNNRCFIFNIVVAIHLILLKKAGDEDDIVLSIPVGNRATADEKVTIGCLFSPILFRFHMIANEPILPTLHRIKSQLLADMLHTQYNWPALLGYLNEEARKQGGVGYSTNKECNLITEKEPFNYNNCLFADRLDNKPGRRKIPTGAFDVQARQSNLGLSLEILWDKARWPISEEEVAETIGRVLEYTTV